MTSFHFLADLDDPAQLPHAIAAASGAHDVRLLTGWNGCDRQTGAPIESEAAGAVNIEWLRRKGRFSLDVNVFGRGFAPHDTPARLCRAVARALGRAVLFSDCSAFGYSYFSAEPDGSIWAQLVVIGDDDDVMDLAVYAHPDPHHRYPRMTFAADEPLAERPPGAPTGWDAQSADCDTRLPGRVCRAFAGPCPKNRLAGEPRPGR